MKPSDLRGLIQELLKANGFYSGKIDKDFGPLTFRALQDLDLALDVAPAEISDTSLHLVKASEFADPGDIHAFRQCKNEGGSDQQCFRVGDNGIGVWGDDTTVSTPMCALPPEIWKARWGPGNLARGQKVLVRVADRQVTCELRDTMPALAHITNHAGIDLNHFACEELGLHSPVLVTASWQWLVDV